MKAVIRERMRRPRGFFCPAFVVSFFSRNGGKAIAPSWEGLVVHSNIESRDRTVNWAGVATDRIFLNGASMGTDGWDPAAEPLVL